MNTVIKRLSEIPLTKSVMQTNKGTTFYKRAYERGVDGVVEPWECFDYMIIPAGIQFGVLGENVLLAERPGNGTARWGGREIS